ncbi:hypothetical protein BCUE_0543 [Candidatus Kinetoplastibacterium blastocrithidii TCC012E]|uniref:Uncharacterized protein n=1 Tax=Candidatus Kinetoplastidibacterium blastocrithidiae TCC012E TaxID=1208922 RepID=M1LBD6_9PROT|nr:hypothetical protein [Candidatus Kinetoplastibacterium blastocrithidii]AFZ83617.1 hypothetical protein CKBE_00428 [Candidatus Kinetoplastibacterium blastocrithidii (ex Strigomonas culicis)]AGF49738.1 hypothetical protein BCUE_0543 [Candidatus Kinetoplastibacterium blastocrithidii TCC012E]
MNIIIPELIFSNEMNIKLLDLIQSHAPNLYRFINESYAESNLSNYIEENGCTAFETWELKRCGFKNDKNKLFSSGLGPLLAKTKANDPDPVWIIELVHLEIGINGAVIQNPTIENLNKKESLSLYESILPTIFKSEFRIEFISNERWRIFPLNSINTKSFSPKAIAGKNINNFLDYTDKLRNWRKLLNEIEIVWNKHPVNTNRNKNGLETINSLWLYGGALSWDFNKHESIILDDLENIKIYENIELWIKKLEDIDLSLKNHLYDKNNKQKKDIKLTLFGTNRSIEISPLKNLNIFKRIIYSRKNKWQYYLG